MNSTRTRALAIGSGLAGLSFALRAAEHGEVIVLTKAQVSDANTSYAQGGIAAAVGESDSWKLHEKDTLIAGAGACDPEAVRFLVKQAPEAIRWLTQMGARFDTAVDGDFALGLEGGHSQHRILHHADVTGWEIERAMVAAVRKNPRIQVIEHAFVTELLMDNGRCVGAAALLEGLGMRTFLADQVLLATGGAGQMYRHTTNPRVATADGVAIGIQLGAAVQDMEFQQFHPTTLSHPQLRGFLITEATRGAGATLRNHQGRRFMIDYDARLELAPRDVVARAMDAEMKRLDTWCLYLDLTHLDPHETEKHFPNIAEKLKGVGIDIRYDWIPVVPAQHYSCGGVVTDLDGRTNIPGLFAAGEVARTGVHGANRLASNSLLEAVVFAHAAAEAEVVPIGVADITAPVEPKCPSEADSVRLRKQLQQMMTEHVGIVRTNEGLAEAAQAARKLKEEYDRCADTAFSAYGQETKHLILAATSAIEGAAPRTANVGLHYNSDLD